MDTTRFTPKKEDRMNVEIEVVAWSGNRKPFRAHVKVDGKMVGFSGFCTSAARARVAGERVAADFQRENAIGPYQFLAGAVAKHGQADADRRMRAAAERTKEAAARLCWACARPTFGPDCELCPECSAKKAAAEARMAATRAKLTGGAMIGTAVVFTPSEARKAVENFADALTDMEGMAFASAMRSSDSNGHDFGFVEDVVADLARHGINGKATGALITNLVKKGAMVVHEAIVTNEGSRDQMRWTQFVIAEKFTGAR